LALPVSVQSQACLPPACCRQAADRRDSGLIKRLLVVGRIPAFNTEIFYLGALVGNGVGSFHSIGKELPRNLLNNYFAGW
jgi:hypothetical protein